LLRYRQTIATYFFFAGDACWASTMINKNRDRKTRVEKKNFSFHRILFRVWL
jgi:hypothetical protein